MSTSLDGYAARLSVLRDLYTYLREYELASAPTTCIEEEMYEQGRRNGFMNSAELVLLHVKSVQARMRYILNKPNKSRDYWAKWTKWRTR